MKPLVCASVACACGAVLYLAACVSMPVNSDDWTTRFKTEVKPILEYYCIECHDTKSQGQYGGLSIETGMEAMITGRHAPVIIRYDPDQSLLYRVLRFGHEDPLGMPPAPDKISDEQLACVRDWIKAGAPWPAGEAGRLRLPR